MVYDFLPPTKEEKSIRNVSVVDSLSGKAPITRQQCFEQLEEVGRGERRQVVAAIDTHPEVL